MQRWTRDELVGEVGAGGHREGDQARRFVASAQEFTRRPANTAARRRREGDHARRFVAAREHTSTDHDAAA